jgi:hypothetical protein
VSRHKSRWGPGAKSLRSEKWKMQYDEFQGDYGERPFHKDKTKAVGSGFYP